MKRKSRLLIVMILFFAAAVTVFIFIDIHEWGFVWSMAGICDYGDDAADMQKCVFDRSLYQDYKLDFIIAKPQVSGTGLSGDNCSIRLLDVDHNVLKEWDSAEDDFEARIGDDDMNKLYAVEVLAHVNNEDSFVSYDVVLYGRVNYLKKLGGRGR